MPDAAVPKLQFAGLIDGIFDPAEWVQFPGMLGAMPREALYRAQCGDCGSTRYWLGISARMCANRRCRALVKEGQAKCHQCGGEDQKSPRDEGGCVWCLPPKAGQIQLLLGWIDAATRVWVKNKSGNPQTAMPAFPGETRPLERPAKPATPTAEPEPPRPHLYRPGPEDETMAGQFARFHADHPDVYQQFLAQARLHKLTHNDYGAKAIIEEIRFHKKTSSKAADEPNDLNQRDAKKYKVNNNFSRFYAAMAQRDYPAEFALFFKRRKPKSV
jgi:hypothetical protein